MQGKGGLCAVGLKDSDNVGIRPEACALIAKRIEDNSVQVFALQFTERIFFFMLRLKRKTDEVLVSTLVFAECFGYIPIFNQLKVES